MKWLLAVIKSTFLCLCKIKNDYGEKIRAETLFVHEIKNKFGNVHRDKYVNAVCYVPIHVTVFVCWDTRKENKLHSYCCMLESLASAVYDWVCLRLLLFLTSSHQMCQTPPLPASSPSFTHKRTINGVFPSSFALLLSLDLLLTLSFSPVTVLCTSKSFSRHANDLLDRTTATPWDNGPTPSPFLPI